jgi:glutathione S-transferase
MRYLANSRGKEDWYPTSAKQRARIDAWLDWVHTRLGIEAGTLFFHHVLFPDRRNHEGVVEAEGRLAELLPVMSDALEYRGRC